MSLEAERECGALGWSRVCPSACSELRCASSSGTTGSEGGEVGALGWARIRHSSARFCTNIYRNWRMGGIRSLISPDVLLVASLLLISWLFFRSFRDSRIKRKLPPGNYSWTVLPVVGETRDYLKNPPRFLYQKRAKYGGIFRVSLFGKTSVVLSSPESAKFALVQAHSSFKIGYGPSILDLVDPSRCFADPTMNTRVRKLFASKLGPENVHGCIPAFDELVLSVLDAWEDGATINTVLEMSTMTLKCSLHLLWGPQDCPDEYVEVLRLHTVMDKGFKTAFPVALPFTTYGKAMKAHKDFQQMAKEKIPQARRLRGSKYDVLSSLVNEEMENGSKLRDEEISSVITTLVFAGYRSTASTLVWVFKFLYDNSEVFAEVKEEHRAIQSAKRSGQEGLTWDDIKKMVLTMKVVKETQRLASVVKFMVRESLEEMKYGGYVIPKGWRTYVNYQFHLDENHFPDPQKFDPSRFNEPPKPGTFIPFGAGKHHCPGFEFAYTMILIIIHRVITNFSYEREEENGIVFFPPYLPRDEYLLKIKRL